MMELVMKHHPSPKRWICLLIRQQLETSYSSLNHAQETKPWMCFTLSRWKICFRINEWRHQSRQPISREIVHFIMDWVHLLRNQQYKMHHQQQIAQWVILYKRVIRMFEVVTWCKRRQACRYWEDMINLDVISKPTISKLMVWVPSAGMTKQFSKAVLCKKCDCGKRKLPGKYH